MAASTSSVAEEDDDKQRKRRAQIAEASRRSRARRKKEFQDYKEENDQLWSQNMILRKTLEDLGVHIPPPLMPRTDRGSSTPGAGTSRGNSSDEEDGDDNGHSVSPSPAPSPAAVHVTQNQPLTTTVALLQQQNNSHLMQHFHGTDAVDLGSITTEHSGSSPAAYNDFIQFFERRLSWYFTQLKSDAIRSFASHLPYEEKQRIANLQVRLATKESTSPAMTPSLVAPTVLSARQASASNAEQAVDQDKQVRL
jgi:hypothetical protein